MEVSDLFGAGSAVAKPGVGKSRCVRQSSKHRVNFVSFSTGCGSSVATPGALVLFCHHEGKQAVSVKDQDPKSCQITSWVSSLQDEHHPKQELESRGSQAPQECVTSLPQQKVAVVKHWRPGNKSG